MTDAAQIVFRRPPDVLVTRDDEGHWCECQELGALGHGKTAALALADMMAEIAVSYDGLVGKPDNMLTKDARKVRDKLTELVKIRD
jgi:hypothetical protein